jgi:hypothetical protein
LFSSQSPEESIIMEDEVKADAQPQINSESGNSSNRTAVPTFPTPMPIPGLGPEHSLGSIYPAFPGLVHPAFAMNPNAAAAFAKFQWRKGKWTEEEEMYTKKLIDAFNSGYLKIASGTTLRSFLAERLFW